MVYRACVILYVCACVYVCMCVYMYVCVCAHRCADDVSRVMSLGRISFLFEDHSVFFRLFDRDQVGVASVRVVVAANTLASHRTVVSATQSLWTR